MKDLDFDDAMFDYRSSGKKFNHDAALRNFYRSDLPKPSFNGSKRSIIPKTGYKAELLSSYEEYRRTIQG